ncbi:hypothetical protein ACSBR2_042823 [Camellia fascicularis]
MERGTVRLRAMVMVVMVMKGSPQPLSCIATLDASFCATSYLLTLLMDALSGASRTASSPQRLKVSIPW